ncbi:type II toxin-antitoxin system PemK/MazF family toxin [Geotalea sp. SG265]|uniref:type II toxin-antitoxin system PemK/MazF family toxin n=1 Tax=Geotalea sp. SG265 TaxID=2922867 RepID=UPI001FAFEE8B|nr:type II toxin-antitoxin system PemK/MazF family toxin [Geotalea sp. SG265]
MVINQGDIYWVELDEPEGSEPGYRHPHVIVQNNLFNRSNIKTVLVCPLTTNLKRANAPGNVRLDKKESNLPKESVVNVSQVFTIDKSQLEDFIGTLSPKRMTEILNGIKLVLDPREPD